MGLIGHGLQGEQHCTRGPEVRETHRVTLEVLYEKGVGVAMGEVRSSSTLDQHSMNQNPMKIFSAA